MHREPRDPAKVRLIVIHTNEGPEADHAAPALARYLDSIEGGYHEICDNREYVRCANDNELVWGAGGHNEDAYHICLIGYANQTEEQWADPYSQAELLIAATRVADACRRFNVPAIKLDAVAINSGGRGITDHLSVSRATGTTNPHTDPGVHFPWLKFVVLVRKLLAPPAPKVKPMYDPPLGPIAAVWQDASGKVLAAASPDGAVYAWGVKYCGGANGKPYFAGRKAARLEGPNSQEKAAGKVYTIVDTTGSRYAYPE